VRPDFEELPGLVADSKNRGIFKKSGDHGVALAENVYAIVRSLVTGYANKLDRGSFDAMMSALMRDRAEIPPAELLLFLSDAVGRAVTFRKGSPKPPRPARRTQLGRN